MTIYDLFNAGWTVEPASLYDEEGVEGWRWFDPDYNEHSTVIGCWHEQPPLPDPLPTLTTATEHPAASTDREG